MRMRQVILDTETTGLDPSKGHRLIEVGCLEMINRRLTGRQFHAYINPERDIEAGAATITGLTSEFLADKPKFVDIVEELLAFLQESDTELIIHNAPFDLGFLNYELTILNHPCRPIENYIGVIDTLMMARQLHPGQRNSLDALCSRYQIDNKHRVFHGALLDARLLASVYLAMTAGQTSMPLGMDSDAATMPESRKPLSHIRRVSRNKNIKLRVIRASEAECQAHIDRMTFISGIIKINAHSTTGGK